MKKTYRKDDDGEDAILFSWSWLEIITAAALTFLVVYLLVEILLRYFGLAVLDAVLRFLP